MMTFKMTKRTIDMNLDIFFIRLIGMLDENALACDSLPIRIKIDING